jgi:hypothetical protein
VEGWFPDGKRIYISSKNPQGDDPPRALFSLSVTGGDPEFVMPLALTLIGLAPNGVRDISRDGKVLAVRAHENDGAFSIAISSPIGSPLKTLFPCALRIQGISESPAPEDLSGRNQAPVLFESRPARTGVAAYPPGGVRNPETNSDESAEHGHYPIVLLVSRQPADCDLASVAAGRQFQPLDRRHGYRPADAVDHRRLQPG